MPTHLSPTDEPLWRRRLAAMANNRGWTLAEMPSRMPAEDEEMLHAAHASAHLWSTIGNERNAALAHLLLGQVHALLGNAVLADSYAMLACEFFSANASTPWELAMMHAVVANAAHCRGDAAAHRREYAAAQSAMETITNAENREIFLATWRVIPKPADGL